MKVTASCFCKGYQRASSLNTLVFLIWNMRELAEWQRNFLKGLTLKTQKPHVISSSPSDPAAGAAWHHGEKWYDRKALCISAGTTETQRWALCHQNQQKFLGGGPVSTTNIRLLSSFFSSELQWGKCCFCKRADPFPRWSQCYPHIKFKWINQAIAGLFCCPAHRAVTRGVQIYLSKL